MPVSMSPTGGAGQQLPGPPSGFVVPGAGGAPAPTAPTAPPLNPLSYVQVLHSSLLGTRLLLLLLLCVLQPCLASAGSAVAAASRRER